MVAQPPLQHEEPTVCPTIWGMDPVQLHDRFWAARGVQVVRQGERSAIVHHAELFLLTDPRSLVIFQVGQLIDRFSWVQPVLMTIRLHEARDHGYRERVVTDDQGRFARFHRIYGASDPRMTRVGLTADRRIAELWQNAPDPREGWRQLRRTFSRNRRASASVKGNVYDRSMPTELNQHVRDLIRVWQTPDATIHDTHHAGGGVWVLRGGGGEVLGRFVGPAWVGAGRSVATGTSVVGPVALWDDPARRPVVRDIEWQEIEPSGLPEYAVQSRQTSSLGRMFRRGFDVVFSLVVIALTLPIYPLVMLAIWLEDGRPFFFTHRRETLGGREFPCIKFRSMRNDADKIKAQLAVQNRADGPQFFLDPDSDPRLTRIGRLIRKLNVDELPQFLNVLAGDMAVVGPRPSPRSENQCCPPWREARLAVKPGITGLWQVMRTRQEGMDFQEWIKYDIRYVERQSFWLDLWIIWKTILLVFGIKD